MTQQQHCYQNIVLVYSLKKTTLITTLSRSSSGIVVTIVQVNVLMLNQTPNHHPNSAHLSFTGPQGIAFGKELIRFYLISMSGQAYSDINIIINKCICRFYQYAIYIYESLYAGLITVYFPETWSPGSTCTQFKGSCPPSVSRKNKIGKWWCMIQNEHYIGEQHSDSPAIRWSTVTDVCSEANSNES